MKFHPYSEVFPLLADTELDALASDIKANGQREPITKYKGQVLDGRNRFLACQRAKVRPHFQDFKGDDTAALALVISANVHRRHLTASQLSMATAQIATFGVGANQHEEGVSIETASALTGASIGSTKRARQVLDKGSKALQQAVVSGDVAVSRAASVVDLPKSEQLAAATAKSAKPDVTDEGWVPDDDEDEKIAAAEKEYTASIDKVMAADDKLAAAHAEIKRQSAEIGSLKFSRDGYLNGKAAVTKLLKKEQSKSLALSKKLDSAYADISKLKERIAIMEESAA